MKKELDRDSDLDAVDTGSSTYVSAGMVSELTSRQRQLLAEVYAMIAKAMPTEGRDYRVKIGFPNSESGRSVNVSLVGLTEIGTAFAKHVSGILGRKGV